MINKLINKVKLWKSDGQENINTPENTTAEFVLKYQSDIKKITPLVDFPNINHVYSNPQLWPFFSYRIPGLNQPSVQEIIKHDAIDESNEVELLKRFGRFSVYNPFKLTLQV